jgi:hypothetical protein
MKGLLQTPQELVPLVSLHARHDAVQDMIVAVSSVMFHDDCPFASNLKLSRRLVDSESTCLFTGSIKT